MARKARPGEQLVSGNIGQVKDVGADRLREGVVDSGHLAPASVGGIPRSGDPTSLLDTFSGSSHSHMDLNGPHGLEMKTIVDVSSTPPGVGLQIR